MIAFVGDRTKRTKTLTLSILDFHNALRCLRCGRPLITSIEPYPEFELHYYFCKECKTTKVLLVGNDFYENDLLHKNTIQLKEEPKKRLLR